jgi:hypothetical protein
MLSNLSGAPFFVVGARAWGKGGTARRRLLLLCSFSDEFAVIELGSELDSSRSSTDAGVGLRTALRAVDHARAKIKRKTMQ